MATSLAAVSSLTAAALLAACAPNGEETAGRAEAPADGVRFVLEVAATDHGPVFVQLVTESRPVGWLDVRGEDGPVALEPMCEVPDCDEDPVVCGAAIPRVRRIAERDGAGSVAYAWDGTTSVVEEPGQCERRIPAPPGPYTARFCWAYEADADPSADASAASGVSGTLAGRTCGERAFTLGEDREVVLRLPG